jgi:small multidrug resistance family-3 protein
MGYLAILSLLFVAALLEAGGDALVRTGFQAPSLSARTFRVAAGGFVLLLYGCVVNAPPWEFGRLIGVYVVFFFLTAQGISWITFHQGPAVTTWLGGALIVIGGAIISCG